MYEDRILAFIDVLGFSNSIKKSINNGIEDVDETKRIHNLLENVQWHLNYEKENYSDFSTSRVVNQFSDSLIISYLKTEESAIFLILLDILFLCAEAIKNGFLLRGAIVCDKLFHTEQKIFGPALVKAYELESKLAIYPRIILDDDILEIAAKYHSKNHDSETEVNYINEIIMKDFDGLYFINYLDAIESEFGLEEMPEYFECLKRIIIKLGNSDNPSIKSKYLWLKEKFNFVISKYKNNYNNKRALKEFPDLYNYYKDLKLL